MNISDMPLFFRYVAGNVIDVSTITRTIAELKANGVNTKFAILDAGYYTEVNADALIDAGVSFMARMKSNFKVYQRAVKNHLPGLESKKMQFFITTGLCASNAYPAGSAKGLTDRHMPISARIWRCGVSRKKTH